MSLFYSEQVVVSLFESLAIQDLKMLAPSQLSSVGRRVCGWEVGRMCAEIITEKTLSFLQRDSSAMISV